MALRKRSAVALSTLLLDRGLAGGDGSLFVAMAAISGFPGAGSTLSGTRGFGGALGTSGSAKCLGGIGGMSGNGDRLTGGVKRSPKSKWSPIFPSTQPIFVAQIPIPTRKMMTTGVAGIARIRMVKPCFHHRYPTKSPHRIIKGPNNHFAKNRLEAGFISPPKLAHFPDERNPCKFPDDSTSILRAVAPKIHGNQSES